MFRSIQDSGYPSGGVVAGTGTSSFQQSPTLEGIDASVLDSRASGSTIYGLGTLWVEAFVATNLGDGNYIPSATAAAAYPLFSYGILTGVPTNPTGLPAQSAPTPNTTAGGSNELRIRQKGTCLALCITGGTYAIAAGTLLVAAATNPYLTPIGATTLAPGIVLAIAKGTQAVNLGPLLVAVNVGGY